MQLKSEVLPAPLGPMRLTMAAGGDAKSTSCSTRVAGKAEGDAGEFEQGHQRLLLAGQMPLGRNSMISSRPTAKIR